MRMEELLDETIKACKADKPESSEIFDKLGELEAKYVPLKFPKLFWELLDYLMESTDDDGDAPYEDYVSRYLGAGLALYSLFFVGDDVKSLLYRRIKKGKEIN